MVCPHGHAMQVLHMSTNRFLSLAWSTAVHRTARRHVSWPQDISLAAGVLPSEWARMQNINDVSLSYNKISGTPALGSLRKMWVL